MNEFAVLPLSKRRRQLTNLASLGHVRTVEILYVQLPIYLSFMSCLMMIVRVGTKRDAPALLGGKWQHMHRKISGVKKGKEYTSNKYGYGGLRGVHNTKSPVISHAKWEKKIALG